MRYAIVGYGKMGRTVDELAAARGHERRAVIDPDGSIPGALPLPDVDALRGVEVAFEFSEPAVADANVSALVRAGVRVVCGTTGWSPPHALDDLLRERDSGAVIAPNFSVGMNLFYRLVREAGRLLGSSRLYQPFVLESHHRAKKDAPSGTARNLASILLEVDPVLARVIEGNPTTPLDEETLQVTSVRAGSDPGTHTVGYDGDDEKITLTHTLRGRTALALGAVLAGEWILERRGLHGFDAVLETLIEPPDQAESGGDGGGKGGTT